MPTVAKALHAQVELPVEPVQGLVLMTAREDLRYDLATMKFFKLVPKEEVVRTPEEADRLKSTILFGIGKGSPPSQEESRGF